MEGEGRKETESHVVRIGPKLKGVLDKQKDNVSEVTMEVVDASDWEAGEIIAKKVEDNNLV